MPAPKLTRDILLASLAGFQLDKQRIDSQIAEVQAMLDGAQATNPSVSNGTPTERRGKGKRSASVRKRMAEAQKARWAKIKGESESVSPEPPKTKRHISEEGIKNITAVTKKRRRSQKANAVKSAPVRKTAPKKSA